MTKVIGPLFSLEARGALGHTLTYAKTGNTSYTKAYKAPTNPSSTAQQIQRQMVSVITKSWADAYPLFKATWQPAADANQTTPYHAYLRSNLRDWAKDTLPTLRTPRLTAYSYDTFLFYTVDFGSYVTMTAALYNAEEIPFVLQIAANPNAIWTPAKTDTIHLSTNWQGTADDYHQTITWNKPLPLTYYFAVRFSSLRGYTLPWYHEELD